MKITRRQLRRIIREATGTNVSWKESPPRSSTFLFDTPKGTYMWRPSVGFLEFQSNTTGRVQRLSKDLNPRRSGGAHDMRTEDQATARVQAHMRRQR